MGQSLLTRAAQGEQEAFRELTDPYRRELQFHCYRILGSMQDAEDALQETLLSAWRGLSGYEGTASLRAWLYRIATNRCLDALRRALLPVAAGTRAAIRPAGSDEARRGDLAQRPDALPQGSSIRRRVQMLDTRLGRPSSSRSSQPCSISHHANAPSCFSATSSASTPPR